MKTYRDSDEQSQWGVNEAKNDKKMAMELKNFETFHSWWIIRLARVIVAHMPVTPVSAYALFVLGMNDKSVIFS